ncbi:hypothetical protein CDAR_564241 [Caerostris darwini]|uniref:Uncharacterized protein n=1 Tax=Caerostris darwini TaxID=1538125 RepID=A0AAV4VJ32_9ARAC|nr:hypothetical protein CDAR_564241 [Caerostris darwini]
MFLIELEELCLLFFLHVWKLDKLLSKLASTIYNSIPVKLLLTNIHGLQHCFSATLNVPPGHTKGNGIPGIPKHSFFPSHRKTSNSFKQSPHILPFSVSFKKGEIKHPPSFHVPFHPLSFISWEQGSSVGELPTPGQEAAATGQAVIARHCWIIGAWCHHNGGGSATPFPCL